MTIHKTPTVTGQSNNKQGLGLIFNWQDWMPYFEDQDIPDGQKREMIETLWNIVVAFVDLGFDLNPHQQVQNTRCNDAQENAGQTLDLKAVLEQAVLVSDATEAVQAQTKRKPLPITPK